MGGGYYRAEVPNHQVDHRELGCRASQVLRKALTCARACTSSSAPLGALSPWGTPSQLVFILITTETAVGEGVCVCVCVNHGSQPCYLTTAFLLLCHNTAL